MVMMLFRNFIIEPVVEGFRLGIDLVRLARALYRLKAAQARLGHATRELATMRRGGPAFSR